MVSVCSVNTAHKRALICILIFIKLLNVGSILTFANPEITAFSLIFQGRSFKKNYVHSVMDRLSFSL